MTKVTEEIFILFYTLDILIQNPVIQDPDKAKECTFMINQFQTATFNSEVLQSTQPVMVDFWAPWCSHCRALEPALEEFSQDTPNLKIGKVNVDEEPELAKQFRIMTIPTVLLIQDGKIIDKKIAPSDPEDLEEMLESLNNS